MYNIREFFFLLLIACDPKVFIGICVTCYFALGPMETRHGIAATELLCFFTIFSGLHSPSCGCVTHAQLVPAFTLRLEVEEPSFLVENLPGFMLDRDVNK